MLFFRRTGSFCRNKAAIHWNLIVVDTAVAPVKPAHNFISLIKRLHVDEWDGMAGDAMISGPIIIYCTDILSNNKLRYSCGVRNTSTKNDKNILRAHRAREKVGALLLAHNVHLSFYQGSTTIARNWNETLSILTRYEHATRCQTITQTW